MENQEPRHKPHPQPDVEGWRFRRRVRLVDRRLWLLQAARRKNGLNLQIWLSGALVLAACLPLAAAFMWPVLSTEALISFAIGTVTTAVGWALYVWALQAKEQLIEQIVQMGYTYDELEQAAVQEMPRLARLVFVRQ